MLGERGPIMTKSIDEVTREINSFVDQINQGLQISTPSKLLQDIMKGQSLSVAMGLFPLPTFSQLIANAAEQEQLIAEIAALANVTPNEIKEFSGVHSFGLELIKHAIQAGAKLDEEDIRKTMEERAGYKAFSWHHVGSDATNEIIAKSAFEQQYTFIVTTPTNDRITIKAAYCEVDGDTLYFEDDNRETIYALAVGHWVRVERVEEESSS